VSANDCSFFPGIGTSGIYTSADGGLTWQNRGLLDDQASWRVSDLVSDGDPVIVYGPKPDGQGGFSYRNGACAYYATLASSNPGRRPARRQYDHLCRLGQPFRQWWAGCHH
jgi:hypothetical protein